MLSLITHPTIRMCQTSHEPLGTSVRVGDACRPIWADARPLSGLVDQVGQSRRHPTHGARGASSLTKVCRQRR
jgi:hypothetical protein